MYEQVYPGIDLFFYGNEGQLEHDFVVAPGADPGDIRLAFEGAEKLEVNPNGDLVVQVAGETVSLRKPLVYQVTGNGKQESAGRYVLQNDSTVGFELAGSDASSRLLENPI